MYYAALRWKLKKKEEQARAVHQLLLLREQLDAAIPSKDSEDHLLLATWNIRDFGKPTAKRRGWGPRLPETWFYIAEVLSRFDFVAVQEINELEEWGHVMDILGYHWSYIATDVTDSASGGNGERMVFVYDRRKVQFQNIAGEIVLPPELLISQVELKKNAKKKLVAGNQFKRTPFMASFQSGWLKFDICTVHLYYGASSGEKLEQRIEEIATIAKYLSERADRSLGKERALFLLGDFNITHPDHKTMQALTGHGFVVPEVLQQNPTTQTGKHYDQIGFKTKPEVLEFVENGQNAGVIPLFDALFTEEQFKQYKADVRKSSAGKKAKGDKALLKVYRDWRTYQFSDHYPMWVRLQTDDSDAYLRRMAFALES